MIFPHASTGKRGACCWLAGWLCITGLKKQEKTNLEFLGLLRGSTNRIWDVVSLNQQGKEVLWRREGAVRKEKLLEVVGVHILVIGQALNQLGQCGTPAFFLKNNRPLCFKKEGPKKKRRMEKWNSNLMMGIPSFVSVSRNTRLSTESGCKKL